MFYTPQDSNKNSKVLLVVNPYPLQSRDKDTEGYVSGYFTGETVKEILNHYTPEELEQCIYSHDIRERGNYKAYFYLQGKKSNDNLFKVLKELGHIPKDYKRNKDFVPNFIHVNELYTPNELDAEVKFPKTIKKFGETYIYTSCHDGYFLKKERKF